MLKETETILKELTELMGEIPTETLEKAVNAVNGHRRVFVGAAGRSGLMLKAFAMRLAQMGCTVYAVGETVTPALEKGDLLILASASGSTAGVCRWAQTAGEIGADLFVITAAAESPLTRLHPADVLLPAPSKQTEGASLQPMGSLFEQALLIFCDSVALALSGNSADMKRRHANLE